MSKTILIVDDDKLIRSGMAAMLRADGYEVLEAEDGKAGLDLALTEQPHLVITDVRMPQLDGVAMLSELRANEWGAKVPVIVLSNDESTSTINSALQSGVTTYLDKVSLDQDALRQQIATILGD